MQAFDSNHDLMYMEGGLQPLESRTVLIPITYPTTYEQKAVCLSSSPA